MHARLRTQFDRLEADRKQLLTEVSTQSEAELSRPPAPGKWSALQILTHLFISEKLSVGYMKKKSLAIDSLDESGFIEALKIVVLKISQRLPIRYKAPRVVLDHTPETLPLGQLTEQWNKLRHDLHTFLESIEAKNVRKKIYKHPIAGRLDAHQALLFFQEHFHHHKPQINRLLSKSPDKV